MIDKGDWKQALVEIDELQQSTPKTLETRSILASCHLLRARALQHLGDLTKAWAESDRAIKIAKDAKEPAIEAEAMCVVANIHWKKGKLDESLAVLEKAAAAALAAKDDRTKGIVSLEMASVHMKKEEYSDAEREFRDAILSLERSGEKRHLVRAYNNFAHVFFYQGLWQKAEEMFLKCKKLAERSGYRTIGAWAAFNRAESLIELKRMGEAKTELSWALPILEEVGDNYGQAVTTSIYSVISAMEGDFVKSEEYLARAVELNKKIDIPHMAGRLAYDRAMICKYRGDRTHAVKLLKEAREVYQRTGATSEIARIDKKLAELK
jgi:tetratricopeptide (TPR) repeat protein